jgi:hypothetical protein
MEQKLEAAGSGKVKINSKGKLAPVVPLKP